MADVETALRQAKPNMPSWIAITIKSAKERKDMVIEDNRTIAQLKALVAKELNVTKDQLCLVFHSTSLKDSSSLRQCGIEEGSVVRAVVKSVTTTPDGKVLLQNQAALEDEISATPFGLGALGGLAGLVELGFGSNNFSDLQKKMQKKLHSDPELMKSLLDNPVVKDVMSKPELYGQLIASNPFVAEIVQENPEATEVLENPVLMKQMVSLASRPALLKELIDPKYKDFVAQKNGKAGDVPDDVPDAKRQKLDGESDDKPSEDKNSNEGFMGKGTESLLKQMIEHSKDMPNILQAPYVQSAINYAASNPEYLRTMMNHIPGVNDSEAMKKQLDLALPYFAQQLTNPEVQSLLCNPRALQAMLDVQEGLRELHQEVPGYFTSRDDASNPDHNGSNILNEVLSSVTSHLSDLPDEEKYATQLRHLHHMGFTDAEENLKILVASAGDINSAIIHHLQNQYNSQHQADDYQQAVDEANYEHHEQLQEVYQSQEGQQDQPIGDQLLLGEHEEGQIHPDEHSAEPDLGDKGVSNKVEGLLLLEGEGSDAEAAFAMNPQTEE